MPTTVELLSILSITTLFAPILTFEPIVTFPRTLAPLPIITFDPILGCLLKVFSFSVEPRVTP